MCVLFKYLFLFLNMYVCVCVSMHILAHISMEFRRGYQIPLELELHITDAGNWTQGLFNNGMVS